MDNINLYIKLSTLPDDLKAEVSDFVDFLVAKRKKSKEKKIPQFGSGKGMFILKPDFDEPLDDLKEYMHQCRKIYWTLIDLLRLNFDILV